MKFWPFTRKQNPRRLVLTSAGGNTSPCLKSALEEAAKTPLNDLTFRIVAAFPQTRFVSDVTLFQMGAARDAYEKRGSSPTTTGAVAFLALAAEGKRPPNEEFKYVALAFFDREFTVGANQGKTEETAWNTLTLDVELTKDEIRVNRDACRIEYPIGRIDLRFPFGSM
jgi:hypothetical protein